MRRLVVSMNLTLDGFMAGLNGELNWHFNYWSSEMLAYASHQLMQADAILLGRVTYEAMARYWPMAALQRNLAREDEVYANMMNHYPKTVFSHTLKHAQWQNAHLVNGALEEEVHRLKQLPGRNLMVYGSGSIVHQLFQGNLVDACTLWVHPLVLGEGRPFFHEIIHPLCFSVRNSIAFSSGVVVTNYQLKKEE